MPTVRCLVSLTVFCRDYSTFPRWAGQHEGLPSRRKKNRSCLYAEYNHTFAASSTFSREPRRLHHNQNTLSKTFVLQRRRRWDLRERRRRRRVVVVLGSGGHGGDGMVAVPPEVAEAATGAAVT